MVVNVRESIVGSNAYDCAVEASGSADAFPTIMKGLKKGSNLVLVGMMSNNPELNVNTFLKKEFLMHGVYRYANDFQPAINLLSSGKIETGKIISHEYNFDELIEAFKFADDSEQNKMKVMIKY